MRRILAILLGASVLSASAQAALLTLTVDQSTGAAWIENKSNETIIFDGYNIASVGKHLSATNWRSFEDWFAADNAAATAALGNKAGSWGEFLENPDSLVEVNITGETTAQPGFKVAVGNPISQFVANDLSFYFSDFTKPPALRNTLATIELTGTNPHPWQNGTNPLDTDNSGGAPVALDALVVINALNDGGARALPVPPSGTEAPPPFLDVNGDDQLSPLDALMVINHLNEQSAAQAVPEPSTGILALGGLGAMVVMGGGYRAVRRRQTLATAKAAS
jgi:hypothetical protein